MNKTVHLSNGEKYKGTWSRSKEAAMAKKGDVEIFKNAGERCLIANRLFSIY